jgi:hypothetical protein
VQWLVKLGEVIMMAKVYAVRIETCESVIVYEFDTPITMGRLSNIINNYSSSSKIVSINVYTRTVSDVE